MPWYVPAVLVPAYVLSAYLNFKALTELERGVDTLNVLLLGGFAGDHHFTARGRRYRMWGLGILGGAVFAVILIWLVGRLE
jgi:hypothetical protein